MCMEAAVSLGAAWLARSPALLAFGGDSAVELLSASVVFWRFSSPSCREHGAGDSTGVRTDDWASPKSRKPVSYLGLNPSEESSGGRQRLGSISKQGNSMLRFLLVEAAQTASIYDPELRRDYQRLKFRRGSGVAKVAIARKLAVRLYWKLRDVKNMSHGSLPANAARIAVNCSGV
jgi:hypothetical protein